MGKVEEEVCIPHPITQEEKLILTPICIKLNEQCVQKPSYTANGAETGKWVKKGNRPGPDIKACPFLVAWAQKLSSWNCSSAVPSALSGVLFYLRVKFSTSDVKRILFIEKSSEER